MNYPTPINPLVLLYRGHIPALKNNKQLSKEHKPIPNGSVLNFVARVKSSVMRQVLEQGFDRMVMPCPVAAYVEIYFASKQEHQLSNSDGDNAYTTLQETWQPESRALGSALGIIDNDRQIISANFEVYPVPSKMFEGAKVYLWQASIPRGPRNRQWIHFWSWLSEHEAVLRLDEEETIDFEDLNIDLF